MLDFGPLAAQSDAHLLEYYVPTQQTKHLIDFAEPLPNYLLVARAGSGKTALLRWLADEQFKFISLQLLPETVRYAAGDETMNLSDLRVLLKSELQLALLAEMAKSTKTPTAQQQECKAFISNNSWSRFAKKVKAKIGGLSFMGFGLRLNPSDRRDYLRTVAQTGQLTAARDLLVRVSNTTPLLLAVDNPEEIVGQGLDALTEENARRTGAFLSVLNDLHGHGLRVVSLVKEQVLQAVRMHYDDFNQFADRVSGLRWQAADLVQLLQDRVDKRLGRRWETVFDFSPEQLETEVLPLLVNGPRDLLALCNHAGRKADFITLEALIGGRDTLAHDKLNDLAVHYRQWPKIDQFARAMMELLSADYDSSAIPLGGVQAVFEKAFADPRSPIHALRSAEQWIDLAKWESPPVDERMLVIGLLGFKSKDGATFYPWAGRDLEGFHSAASHFISPLFRDA